MINIYILYNINIILKYYCIVYIGYEIYTTNM